MSAFFSPVMTVQVHLHGASHFGQHRQFQTMFRDALEAGGSNVSRNYQIGSIRAVSGGKLTDVKVEEILAAMETCKRGNIKSLFIVQLGGNNIRQARDKGHEMRLLVARFGRLAGATNDICRLALIGLVPSPKTHETTRFYFETVDLHLKELSKKNNYVFFLDLKWRFCAYHTHPRMDLFVGWKDVHLNPKGTRLLAKSIVNMMVHTFSFKDSTPNGM